MVARFQSSGLSRAAFARSHGLVLSTLIRWLTEAREKPTGRSPVIWRELEVSPGLPVTAGWAMEIVGLRGLTVRCRDPLAVAELVQLLQER